MFCAIFAGRLIAQQEWNRDAQTAIGNAGQHYAMISTNNAGFVMRLVVIIIILIDEFM